MNNLSPTINDIAVDSKTASNLIATDSKSDSKHFITIGKLAKHYERDEITVRRYLLKLIKQGKLIEGRDFFKDDFKDKFHFFYKINQQSFNEKVDLKQLLASKIDSKSDSKIANNNSKDQEKTKETAKQIANNPDSNLLAVDSKTANSEFLSYLKTESKGLREEKEKLASDFKEEKKRLFDKIDQKDKDIKEERNRVQRRNNIILALKDKNNQLQSQILLIEKKAKKKDPEPIEYVPKEKDEPKKKKWWQF